MRRPDPLPFQDLLHIGNLSGHRKIRAPLLQGDQPTRPLRWMNLRRECAVLHNPDYRIHSGISVPQPGVIEWNPPANIGLIRHLLALEPDTGKAFGRVPPKPEPQSIRYREHDRIHDQNTDQLSGATGHEQKGQGRLEPSVRTHPFPDLKRIPPECRP
ncbi:MAG: hypothetical protein BWY82_00535 [Verrucomicrobia bacterium ADurb.Bin474]|nr:MAG: hypothetical protein BWY82_00535 [Verrucomicrobia bacterium ADurb.Bin474]